MKTETESPVHTQRAFIAHDYCGWNAQYGRFTVVPTGETLVCHAWMGQHAWDKAQLK